jgi:hypothetical protein
MSQRKYSPPLPLLLVGLVVAAAVCVGIWFFFADSISERWNRQEFSLTAWQAPYNHASTVRIRMVDDLLNSHNFRGMTREQVIAIVGEPDKTEYFRDFDMIYWLGSERGFMSIDSEWLVFRLDDQNRVLEYKIVRD